MNLLSITSIARRKSIKKRRHLSASLISGLLLKPGLILKLSGYCGHAEIMEKMFEKGGAGKLLILLSLSFSLTLSLLLFFSYSFSLTLSFLLFSAFNTRDPLHMSVLFMLVMPMFLAMIMSVSGFMYVYSPFLKSFLYRTVYSIFQSFLLNV